MSTSMPAAAPKKPRPRWQKVALIVVGVVVALIVIGAIVGPKKTDNAPAASSTSTSDTTSMGSSQAAPVPTTESVTTEPATSEPATSELTADPAASYAAALASRPKPTDADVRQIGVALVDIQPEMAEIKVTHIESWSDSVCGDIWTWVEGQSGDRTLAERAAYRFNGGDRPELTEEQGQQIVDVIKSTYCHS